MQTITNLKQQLSRNAKQRRSLLMEMHSVDFDKTKTNELSFIIENYDVEILNIEKELLQLLITDSLLLKLNTLFDIDKVNEVLDSLLTTYLGFELELSLEEIWEQEKEYYISHGMSAFDCGYCGKKNIVLIINKL